MQDFEPGVMSSTVIHADGRPLFDACAAPSGASLKAPSPPGPAFEIRLASTPRGARLARRLAAVRLDAWGIPYGTDPHDAIVLIVAEPTANAVSHGHVPGRYFHLRFHTTPDGRTVRVEVTDTPHRTPPPPRGQPIRPRPCSSTWKRLSPPTAPARRTKPCGRAVPGLSR
ncbi:ATP-binding protein [Streptomyces sp. NPDC059781]|uniref:ATP-binding protein n=1 Tax=Streptomyces sp. NPDC059781 TaxID=3346943 RepID=UPI0036572BC2